MVSFDTLNKLGGMVELMKDMSLHVSTPYRYKVCMACKIFFFALH